VKNFIKEYFTFNNREKRGLIILTSIIVILFLALLFQEKFITPNAPTDFKEFEAKIDKATSFENDSAEGNVTQNSEPETQGPRRVEGSNDKTPNHLFPFDPNTITDEEWKTLGIKEKQINTINNYKSKGGKFFSKEDLKKIYGISANDYNRLETYITIENSEPKNRNNSTSNKSTTTIIEINSADSIALLTLKGIGPSFASRIIKYRNLLSGFYKKEQLLEVYGFTSEMLNNISDKIIIDSKKINPININTSDFNQLKKHPYIKYNNAKLIVNYRNAHGAYKSVAEIKNIQVINDSIFNKMSSYLTTGN
jgi:competence protein ComEA